MWGCQCSHRFSVCFLSAYWLGWNLHHNLGTFVDILHRTLGLPVYVFKGSSGEVLSHISSSHRLMHACIMPSWLKGNCRHFLPCHIHLLWFLSRLLPCTVIGLHLIVMITFTCFGFALQLVCLLSPHVCLCSFVKFMSHTRHDQLFATARFDLSFDLVLFFSFTFLAWLNWCCL